MNEQVYYPLVIDQTRFKELLTDLRVNPNLVEIIIAGDFFEADEANKTLLLPSLLFPCLLGVDEAENTVTEDQFFSLLVYIWLDSLADAYNQNPKSLQSPLVDPKLIERFKQGSNLTLTEFLAVNSYLDQEYSLANPFDYLLIDHKPKNDASNYIDGPLCLPLYLLTAKIGERPWVKVFELECQLLFGSQLSYFFGFNIEAQQSNNTKQLNHSETVRILTELGLYPQYFKNSPYPRLGKL